MNDNLKVFFIFRTLQVGILMGSRILFPLPSSIKQLLSLFSSHQLQALRYKRLWTKMDLTLDENIRGMTQLNRDIFVKDIHIPSVQVVSSNVGKSMKILKKYLLKIEKLKPVRETESEKRSILLDPINFKSYEELDSEEKNHLNALDISNENFSNTVIHLKYENFKLDDILKAVLPKDQEGCTSFSRIGHIIHLNLRDHLLPYKLLIGQVLMDKIHGVKTVVNKNHIIDSTYRNFQMEVLAGVEDFTAEVKENGCTFKFDFSKVYWNSRLCTEHERIIKLLPENTVLFDVFAGVGPFSIPAAKLRKCQVFANDLNPFSFEWLNENVRLNKVKTVETFNQDGRDFIRDQLGSYLLKRPTQKIHVTMNLPAIAVEFLDAYIGLLEGSNITEQDSINLTVHVYGFCQESASFTEIRERVESILKCNLEEHVVEIVDVRDISPKKHMMRMSFQMPVAVLLACDEVSKSKRIKLESEK